MVNPTGLLGTILLGNNAVNFYAATVATLIAQRQFGETSVTWVPFVLTCLFLVFAEITPKTIATRIPETLSFASVYILQPLSRLLYPFVWLLNGCTRVMMRSLFGESGATAGQDKLSREELRSLLREGQAHLTGQHKDMLLSVLELEEVTVDDIMVPRPDIHGINLENSIDEMIEDICNSAHTVQPVYSGELDKVVGILHARNIPRWLQRGDCTRASLLQETIEPYFVPQNTPLHTQLLNFQRDEQRFGLVVDEYGGVQGMVTLGDVLEEIVGEFTSNLSSRTPSMRAQPDGSHIIDGSALLRELNKTQQWQLPQDGPKTLSGLIIEHLEFIPQATCCLVISDYRIEVIKVFKNTVRIARITPPEVYQQQDWLRDREPPD